ncbi:MAG: hypothetical protein KAU21_18875 [Gammaproteobacteria bacterium]|nr:hypothetical protein [Gammaproteobacteria bacterium]
MCDSAWKLNWLPIIIGLSALILGVVLYVYDRPASHIYFVPDFLSQYQEGALIFGFIGNYMPAFLHVFAFCLISFGVLGSAPRMALGICLFWLFVDGVFEIAQHQDIAYEIVPHIPNWFKSIPILENTENYFIHGRFDPADLVAILFGAVIAYILIYILHEKIKSN